MPHCFVVGCKNSTKKRKEGRTYHLIPKQLRSEWLIAIGRSSQHFVIQERVCSDHFHADDFTYVGSRKHIKENVVPSLHLPCVPCKTKLHFENVDLRIESLPSTSSEIEFVSGNTESLPTISALPCTSSEVKSVSEINLPDALLLSHSSGFEGSPLQKMPSSHSSSSDSTELKHRDSTNIKAKKRKLPIHSSDLSLPSSPTKRRRKYFQSPASTSTVASSVKRRIVLTFHNYSLSPQHYLKQVRSSKNRAVHFRKKLKNLRRTTTRRKKKILSLKQVIADISKKYAFLQNAITTLEGCIAGIPLAIMKQMLQNTKTKGELTKSRYSPELRSFAMTLQFYNTKAYDYVRKTFDFVLPAPSTIRKWFSKIDCSPGFTEPSLSALKVRAEEFLEKNGKQLVCALMLDEMAIRKEIRVEKHSHNVWGYTDVGSENIFSNEQEPATEALVLMVVAVNDRFKLPIAYFLINKISGEEKANIISEALRHLHGTGIKILSITCDGPQVNFKMMRDLGCSVTDVDNLKTYFPHPVDGSKVFVIFDICHMLKLIRNNWANSEIFVDPDGNDIKWEYISKLHELQDQEGLYLGNKLRKKHIQWKKAIMKVNLAAQTLSSSVADALEFLCVDLKLEAFKDALPTVRFIKMINKLFDILNSRNPFGRGMKTPLRQANEQYWRPFIEEALWYITNCKDSLGKHLHKTTKRVPFLGFIASINSFLIMYDEEVKQNKSLAYILTYKFSQDHLELLFCSIRSRNGWINNPNCYEFMHTYRRLLIHNTIRSNTGNCIAQDQTNILTISSSQQPLEITDINVLRSGEKAAEDLNKEVELFLPVCLNEFAENVVSYISGFVVKAVEHQIKCSTCIEALWSTEVDEFDNSLKLIRRKTRGGLIIPSHSTRKVCNQIEKKIQIIIKVCGHLPPKQTVIKVLMGEVEDLLTNDNIFVTLNNHVFDISQEETLHKKKLIVAIINAYASIRMNSIAKKYNEEISGERIRKVMSKLILFKHQ